MMTVDMMVKDWLETHGCSLDGKAKHYDGLCKDDCGCCLKEGLFPCAIVGPNCRAGYRKDFKNGEDCGLDDCDGNGTAHWHIQELP